MLNYARMQTKTRVTKTRVAKGGLIDAVYVWRRNVRHEGVVGMRCVQRMRGHFCAMNVMDDRNVHV